MGEQATETLAAIGAERARRAEIARVGNAAAAQRTREKVQSLSFEDRIKAAFTELPPVDWERATLKALGDHPGGTTSQLSEAVGYSGNYMNWFGYVCRDREPWLGQAQTKSDGRIIYSELLVDFVAKKDTATGQSTKEWWLKPAARTALQSLGLV